MDQDIIFLDQMRVLRAVQRRAGKRGHVREGKCRVMNEIINMCMLDGSRARNIEGERTNKRTYE